MSGQQMRGVDGLLSLALANLSYSVAWKKLLYDPPLLMPFWTWRDIAALSINILLLATLFWIFIAWSRRSKLRRFHLHAILYLLPLVVILNLYRSSHENRITLFLGSLRMMVFVFIVVCSLALVLLFRFRNKVIPALEVLTLSTLLLIPLNFSRAALVLSRQEEVPPMASVLPEKAPDSPRVVWIIFDETDWRLAFLDRPSGVSLPNYDRLRGNALFAQDGIEAGTDTQLAIPSLISGQKVIKSVPSGKSTLLLWKADSQQPKDWATSANIFSRARDLGFNVGVVGWYLPYCRIFATAITSCYWESMTTRVNSRDPSIATSLHSQWRSLTPLESRLRQIGRYESMLYWAKSLAADPRMGLVFIHMSVPHGPGIYDRKHQKLTAFNFNNGWYYDNLELSDRALGEIRKAMEDAGQWDRTTLLVSSDHSLRPGIMVHPYYDRRVPYLVKAAHQSEGFEYPRQFSAVVSADLISAILGREIETPEQIRSWLDERSSSAK